MMAVATGLSAAASGWSTGVSTAGGEKALPVALHGVRCDSDDRYMLAGPLLAGADRTGCLDAVQDRHLDVHQHEVERRVSQRLEGFLAVADDLDGVTARLQQGTSQTLVDDVVVDHQDVEATEIGRLNGSRATAGDFVDIGGVFRPSRRGGRASRPSGSLLKSGK